MRYCGKVAYRVSVEQKDSQGRPNGVWVDEKVIRIESTYLRITLENKKVKNSEIEEAIKEFYKIFGFNAPKIVSG